MAWKKGESGNPKGRPKVQIATSQAIARMILDATDGGQEIVDKLLGLLRRPVHTPQDANRQAHVAELLLQRCAGRALEVVDITTTEERAPLGTLTGADLDAVEAVIARVEAREDDAPTEH